MSAAFTPGPWEYHSHVSSVAQGPRLGKIAEVSFAYKDSATRDANGHLIAAAPELYEALEAIDEMWSDDGDGGRIGPIDARSGKVREIWQLVRDALAKARGEQVAL